MFKYPFFTTPIFAFKSMLHLFSRIGSFNFKTFSFLLAIGSLSCSPEYLRPTLPGKIPVVKTLSNQNQVAVNCKIQLRASCYSGEESLLEAGFLVSPISGIIENGQSVEKVIVNKSDLTLTNDDEHFFEMDYFVGSTLNLTKYYRPYCKNSRGIGYGEEFSFMTVICIPTVTTSSVSLLSDTGATTGGDVTAGVSVTARGVAYGTSSNPTLSNNSIINGTGTGVFTSVLTGLSASTLYYVRAYATNSVGTAYGNQVSFTTLSAACTGTPTVTDVDNNTYSTVPIGTQCWTQSNLKVSKYRNGNNIPTGLTNSAWSVTTSGAYAIYNNDPVNDGLYGKLYNHYAVTDSRGICPTGWHVPSDAEWTTLENHLGGSNVAGGALKSTVMQPTLWGWNLPNTGATNSSGFTALPAGLLSYMGNFGYKGNYGYWWSSSVSSGSNAWLLYLNSNDISTYRASNYRSYGLSVRCLKD